MLRKLSLSPFAGFVKRSSSSAASYTPLQPSIANLLARGRKDNDVDLEVVVKGWVKTTRTQKRNTFIELNDGSTIENLQVVADSDALPAGYAPQRLLNTLYGILDWY